MIETIALYFMAIVGGGGGLILGSQFAGWVGKAAAGLCGGPGCRLSN